MSKSRPKIIFFNKKLLYKSFLEQKSLLIDLLPLEVVSEVNSKQVGVSKCRISLTNLFHPSLIIHVRLVKDRLRTIKFFSSLR